MTWHPYVWCSRPNESFLPRFKQKMKILCAVVHRFCFGFWFSPSQRTPQA